MEEEDVSLSSIGSMAHNIRQIGGSSKGGPTGGNNSGRRRSGRDGGASTSMGSQIGGGQINPLFSGPTLVTVPLSLVAHEVVRKCYADLMSTLESLRRLNGGAARRAALKRYCRQLHDRIAKVYALLQWTKSGYDPSQRDRLVSVLAQGGEAQEALCSAIHDIHLVQSKTLPSVYMSSFQVSTAAQLLSSGKAPELAGCVTALAHSDEMTRAEVSEALDRLSDALNLRFMRLQVPPMFEVTITRGVARCVVKGEFEMWVTMEGVAAADSLRLLSVRFLIHEEPDFEDVLDAPDMNAMVLQLNERIQDQAEPLIALYKVLADYCVRRRIGYAMTVAQQLVATNNRSDVSTDLETGSLTFRYWLPVRAGREDIAAVGNHQNGAGMGTNTGSSKPHIVASGIFGGNSSASAYMSGGAATSGGYTGSGGGLHSASALVGVGNSLVGGGFGMGFTDLESHKFSLRLYENDQRMLIASISPPVYRPETDIPLNFSAVELLRFDHVVARTLDAQIYQHLALYQRKISALAPYMPVRLRGERTGDSRCDSLEVNLFGGECILLTIGRESGCFEVLRYPASLHERLRALCPIVRCASAKDADLVEYLRFLRRSLMCHRMEIQVARNLLPASDASTAAPPPPPATWLLQNIPGDQQSSASFSMMLCNTGEDDGTMLGRAYPRTRRSFMVSHLPSSCVQLEVCDGHRVSAMICELGPDRARYVAVPGSNLRLDFNGSMELPRAVDSDWETPTPFLLSQFVHAALQSYVGQIIRAALEEISLRSELRLEDVGHYEVCIIDKPPYRPAPSRLVPRPCTARKLSKPEFPLFITFRQGFCVTLRMEDPDYRKYVRGLRAFCVDGNHSRVSLPELGNGWTFRYQMMQNLRTGESAFDKLIQEINRVGRMAYYIKQIYQVLTDPASAMLQGFVRIWYLSLSCIQLTFSRPGCPPCDFEFNNADGLFSATFTGPLRGLSSFALADLQASRVVFSSYLHSLYVLYSPLSLVRAIEAGDVIAVPGEFNVSHSSPWMLTLIYKQSLGLVMRFESVGHCYLSGRVLPYTFVTAGSQEIFSWELFLTFIHRLVMTYTTSPGVHITPSRQVRVDPVRLADVLQIWVNYCRTVNMLQPLFFTNSLKVENDGKQYRWIRLSERIEQRPPLVLTFGLGSQVEMQRLSVSVGIQESAVWTQEQIDTAQQRANVLERYFAEHVFISGSSYFMAERAAWLVRLLRMPFFGEVVYVLRLVVERILPRLELLFHFPPGLRIDRAGDATNSNSHLRGPMPQSIVMSFVYIPDGQGSSQRLVKVCFDWDPQSLRYAIRLFGTVHDHNNASTSDAFMAVFGSPVASLAEALDRLNSAPELVALHFTQIDDTS